MRLSRYLALHECFVELFEWIAVLSNASDVIDDPKPSTSLRKD
jgi:hypothetical protein